MAPVIRHRHFFYIIIFTPRKVFMSHNKVHWVERLQTTGHNIMIHSQNVTTGDIIFFILWEVFISHDKLNWLNWLLQILRHCGGKTVVGANPLI